MLEDPRLDLHVGDGRKRLLAAEQPYDVITVDALRPQSGYSGNVYSVEFYELVAARLAPGGLFAQWVPTERVLASVAEVFPHVATAVGPGPATFLDREQRSDRRRPRRRRSRGIARGRTACYRPSSAHRSNGSSSTPQLRTCAAASRARLRRRRSTLNRDLHPRDEYFLNDG